MAASLGKKKKKRKILIHEIGKDCNKVPISFGQIMNLQLQFDAVKKKRIEPGIVKKTV